MCYCNSILKPIEADRFGTVYLNFKGKIIYVSKKYEHILKIITNQLKNKSQNLSQELNLSLESQELNLQIFKNKIASYSEYKVKEERFKVTEALLVNEIELFALAYTTCISVPKTCSSQQNICYIN